MAQTKALIQALKRSLKAHGKTYADVADALELTEASVKRLFSECSFSLDRLDQACQLIGMEISDLVKVMDEQSGKISQLTVDQEKEISNDLVLLLITVCVLNRWSMEDIVAFYNIDEITCIKKLARLDKLRIIELLPKNRIKLLVTPNFNWIENGPIKQFFQQRIASEYFNARFDGNEENLIVLNGMLSTASSKEFQRKMQRLAREFNELHHEDAGLPLPSRNGKTVIIAMRSWDFGLFRPMIKNEP